MSIRDRLISDLKSAMKSGKRDRVSVLRMVRAKIVEAQVNLRVKKGLDYELSDTETVEVIIGYAKQQRQSIESYRQVDREDLVKKEAAELAIIQESLPRQLSEDEVARFATEAITEAGASTLKDLGVVMKILMPRIHGVADGKVVNKIVRNLLS